MFQRKNHGQAQARKAVQTLVRGVSGSFSFLIHRAKGVYTLEFVEIVRELISNVGFPIACACIMFWEMEQERKAHKEESATWVEALNRNTIVMEKILDKLEASDVSSCSIQ